MSRKIQTANVVGIYMILIALWVSLIIRIEKAKPHFEVGTVVVYRQSYESNYKIGRIEKIFSDSGPTHYGLSSDRSGSGWSVIYPNNIIEVLGKDND